MILVGGHRRRSSVGARRSRAAAPCTTGSPPGVVYSLTAVLTKATVDRLTPSVLPDPRPLAALRAAPRLRRRPRAEPERVPGGPRRGVAAGDLGRRTRCSASVMGVVLFGEHLDAQGRSPGSSRAARSSRCSSGTLLAGPLPAGDRRGAKHVLPSTVEVWRLRSAGRGRRPPSSPARRSSRRARRGDEHELREARPR